MKNSHSRVMKMAHILYKNRPDFAWSDIVRHAWYFEQFRSWLNAGVVTFSFWKKDGSIREAKGTTHPLLIPEDKRPKNNNQSPITNHQSIPYFDLDKQDWRSFNITHFIGFVTRYEIKEKRSKRAVS